MPNFTPEHTLPKSETKIVSNLTPSQIISLLLKQENAPKGPVSTDFKAALYVCLCTKEILMGQALTAKNVMVMQYALASVGYTGPVASYDQYLSALQEFIDKGLLVYLDDDSSFIAPAFKIECEGKIKAGSALKMFKGYQNKSDFIDYVQCMDFYTVNNSQHYLFSYDGEDYPVFSRYVVLPGDTVKVVINRLSRVAFVQEVTAARRILFCTCEKNRGKKLRLRCSDKGFLNYNFNITDIKVKEILHSGDMVIVEIDRESPCENNNLNVIIREVVQDQGSLNGYIVHAVLEHDIPSSWPESVLASLPQIPDDVAAKELAGRVDVRKLPLVTIDGEDARDFDDAVYCKREGNRFHLYVAIADVSYYVRYGSALDNEAQKRCNSVYFPYFVIPMLPQKLSNGICSLNPGVDRLCMICEMYITDKGKIEDYQFYPAVMNSHARLTYTEAHTMLTENRAEVKEHTKCIPWVKDLYEMYTKLKQSRDGRGAFEFESPEMTFMFDQNWSVCGLTPYARDESHMIIEECMIAANICAARFVKEHQSETLYRIHPAPLTERIDKLREILGLYGIKLGSGQTPSEFRQVAVAVSKLDANMRPVLGLQLLRAMSKATYDPKNIGHFGLALEDYAHFTSPIRRYADLQLHRVIKFILERKKEHKWGNIGARSYGLEELVKLGISTSEREKAAADAEYDVDNSLKCEYVQKFQGKLVEGIVSTIMPKMVFITLRDFFIDGALPVSSKGRTSGNGSLTSFGINGQIFHIGSPIRVQILSADPLTRRIELGFNPFFNTDFKEEYPSSSARARHKNEKKKQEDYSRVQQIKTELAKTEDPDLVADNTSKERLFDRLKDINSDTVVLNSVLRQDSERRKLSIPLVSSEQKQPHAKRMDKAQAHQVKAVEEKRPVKENMPQFEQPYETAEQTDVAPVLVKVKRKGNKTEKKLLVGSVGSSGNSTKPEVQVSGEELFDDATTVNVALAPEKSPKRDNDSPKARKKKHAKSNAKSSTDIMGSLDEVPLKMQTPDFTLEVKSVDQHQQFESEPKLNFVAEQQKKPASPVKIDALAEGELQVTTVSDVHRVNRDDLAGMLAQISVDAAEAIAEPIEKVTIDEPVKVAPKPAKRKAKAKAAPKAAPTVAEPQPENMVEAQAVEASEPQPEVKPQVSLQQEKPAETPVAEVPVEKTPVVEAQSEQKGEAPVSEAVEPAAPAAESKAPAKPKRTRKAAPKKSATEESAEGAAVAEAPAKPKRTRKTTKAKGEAVAPAEDTSREVKVAPAAETEAPATPKRTRKTAAKKASSTEVEAPVAPTAEAEAPAPAKPKRVCKPRTKKVEATAAVKAEPTADAAQSAEAPAPTKPKRTRKTAARTKAAPQEEASGEETVAEPKKPKRRTTKAKAQEEK